MFPNHIAIILDGNRRYAKKHNLASHKGHEQGAKTLKTILEHLDTTPTSQCTLYAFSTENFKRSEAEKSALFTLFEEAANQLLKRKDELLKKDVRVQFIGNVTRFPEHIQQLTKKIADLTQHCQKKTLNICFGYGGRDEITHAVQTIAKQVENGTLRAADISEQTIEQSLYLSTSPDLVIRTGGAKRLSNFLPWQSAYSEWFFTNTLWPEMTTQEMDAIIEEFGKRKRNFGK
ncbi:MAG: polyprenyl diphosphate synthase [Candidatus Woesearchaeota archaeon]